MHINKYLLGVSSVVIIGSIGWLSAGTLNISNSNFAKGFPIFKTIFFRSEGKDSINGSTNPEGVRLDNVGIYTAVPNGLPGGGGNVLKLNGANQIYMDPVENANLANDSISNIKITNNSIVNSNFADLAITNTQIQNNSIEIVKFDPGITWPSGGTMFITNNVCTSPNAIVSVNNGTATCALLPTGATATLPACSAGQQPVLSGGIWECVTFNISAGSTDPYRTGSTGGSISNSNIGNVGIGTNNPTQKLTVSGSIEILGSTKDQVYCYSTDTWVPLGTYNQNICAGCNPGFSYNSTSQLCEQNSCLGSGVNGSCGAAHTSGLNSVPTTNLCNTGNPSVVSGSGPWSWNCNGSNGGTNASCYANKISIPINGAVIGGAADGRIIMISANGINVINLAGSFPVSAGQNTDAYTTNGTKIVDVQTDGDPSGGMGAGSVRITDALGNQYCQNYTGASTYTFSNIVINNGLNTVYVVLDSASCNPAPINGICGDTSLYSNGTNDGWSTPYTLCTQGNVINIQGDGNSPACTQTWTCEGINGGSNAACWGQNYYWYDAPYYGWNVC